MYFNLYSKWVAHMYYIEIPQEVTNENAITLVITLLIKKL